MIDKGPDFLIDNLVADLRPTKPLNNILIWLLAFAGFAFTLAFVIIYMGMRNDFNSALNSGTIIWKNGGLFIGALAALFSTIALSRPDTKPKIIVPLLLSIVAVIILWRIIEMANSKPILSELMNTNFGGAQFCVPTIFIAGSGVFAVVWQVWIKQTASQSPQILGASAGLMSALIAGCAYSFHCNMDGIFYYISCYWLPAFFIAAIGYFLGKRISW